MTTSIKSQLNKLVNKTNKYYEIYNHSTQMQDANNRDIEIPRSEYYAWSLCKSPLIWQSNEIEIVNINT